MERDLLALSAQYDIECNRRAKPYGWRWHPNAEVPWIPALDLQQALGFALLERELASSLPSASRSALQPWFEASRRQLKAAAGHAKAARWSQKIAFRSLGPPLLPAKVSAQVMDTVNEALFSEHPIDAEYRSAQHTSHRAVRLHPLGLIHTELITYLVACFDGYRDPRLLALHRLRRVRLCQDVPLAAPSGFDLRRYLESGVLGFGSAGRIKIRLLMTREAAAHLHETPLSTDQTITPKGDDSHVIVEATVEDSNRLEWWIRSFGDSARRL